MGVQLLWLVLPARETFQVLLLSRKSVLIFVIFSKEPGLGAAGAG